MCDFLRCAISVLFPCRRYLLEKIKDGKDIQSPFLCHGKSFRNKIICFL